MSVYALGLNPEPWAIGPVTPTRRKNGSLGASVGQNAQLNAYKEAVRESLQLQNPELVSGEVQLNMWFSRTLARHVTKATEAQINKHWADVTNLQKATEDALQGVLIENDRNVRQVYSTVVDQGMHVLPWLVIQVSPYDSSTVPPWVFDHARKAMLRDDLSKKPTTDLSYDGNSPF